MARKQFLQNVHTTEKYSLAKIAEAQLKDGEIAVFQNTEEPSLGIKVGDTYAQFKDSSAVTKEITIVKKDLQGKIDAINGDSGALKNYLKSEDADKKFETKADASTKKTEAISSAKSYTDAEITKLTGDTDGSLQSQITANKSAIEDNSNNITALSAGTAEKITALEGTSADTSASKSIAGAKKYADEEIAKAVSSVYKVKGTCTYEELPKSGNANGDVWNVTNAHGNVPAGTNYVWLASGDGGSWDALAGTVDLSPYFKTADFNTKLTADTSFTSVKNTAEAAATKTELDAVKKTADAAAVKTDVDTALAKKVDKTDLGTYATQTGIQEALDKKTNKTDFEELQATVKVITGTTLNGYVKTGATSDQKDEMTGYGLRAYANDAVSTAKATLEGNSDSSSGTTTIIGAKKYADAVVKALSDGQVATNTQSISNNASKIAENKAAIENVKKTADSAAQTVTNTSTVVTGVTFSKEGTVITLNLDSIVIDCGDF